jgi:hypothetical protein
MNYYAQGGQAHGLQTLKGHSIQTKDGVPAFGIGGWYQKNVAQPVTSGLMGGIKAVQNIPGIKQVSDLTTQAVKPIDQALVGLDKTVGKAIPGGWGTIAQTAAAMVPGMQPLAIGLGALNGSGVMRKGGNFNLQGAIMGGATAYAMSELGEYARAAGGTPDIPTVDAYGNAVTPTLGATPVPTNDFIGSFAGPNAPVEGDFISGFSGANPAVPASPPSFGSNVMSGNFSAAAGQAGDVLSNAGRAVIEAPGKAIDAVANYDYGNAITNAKEGMGDTISGAGKALTGNANPAAAAAVKAGSIMSPSMALAGTAYGAMSLSDLDAQRDYLKQQQAAGAISNAEYNAELARIEAQADEARKVVAANPLQVNPGIAGLEEGPSLYERRNSGDTLYDKNSYGDTRLYAAGGAVAQSIQNPPDDQTKMMGGSPMTNFMPNLPKYTGSLAEENAAMQANQAAGIQTMGGQATSNPLSNIAQTSASQGTGSSPQAYYGGSQLGGGLGGQLGGSGSQGAFPLQGQYGIVKMAAGGMAPRFLSGGGDGMSDSIKANINGNQEARLADGEFVIPADVVSHIGNGSSKAGAKQLYSMMDRVRQARTGRKSQGKQINPRKLMAA